MTIVESFYLDLLRLVAIPVFAWAAYHDMKTRRVDNRPWIFLSLLGAVLLIGDTLLFMDLVPFTDDILTVRYNMFWQYIAISLFGVIPLAYAAWSFNLFGGADAKALMTLAILFPFPPNFYPITQDVAFLQSLQLLPVSVFSLTIFANTILISLLYPLSMFVQNLLRGRFSKASLFAKPLLVSDLAGAHGITFETADGFGQGLDLDVFRAYLDWRDISIDALEPLDEKQTVHPEGAEPGPAKPPDRWGAEAFFAETSEFTYGMTPEKLNDGLDIISSQNQVWVSPGIPYLVPFFVGLVVAVTYGNLMVALLYLF